MKHKKFGSQNAAEYLCRPFKTRRVGQGVKTPPFHGGITGSIPVRGTGYKMKPLIAVVIRGFAFYRECLGGRFELKNARNITNYTFPYRYSDH